MSQLQSVVNKTKVEEAAVEGLREETKRVLGPIIDTNVKLHKLVTSINERLDVLDRTGRKHDGFDNHVVAAFTNHKNENARKLAARLLPATQIKKFTADQSSIVRATVARRVPMNVVKEMMRSFPNDDELRLIYQRRKSEAQKTLLENERLGDAGKTWEGPELSDAWYETKAKTLYDDYNMSENWEEAVTAFCIHSKATSGVDVDYEKLLDALLDIVEEKEDELMGEARAVEQPGGTWTVFDDQERPQGDFDTAAEAEMYANEINDDDTDLYESVLMSCSKNLMRGALLTESLDPNDGFEVDKVTELVSEGSRGRMYIEKANKLFNVRESTIPRGIKKYVLGEGSRTMTFPSKAKLPHSHGIRPIDEKALDLYVEAWNATQSQEGEPYKLYWDADPCDVNYVGFSLSLR